ncbi:IS1634 family transposase [Candidatus Woesearchaeota archaeon]|nr:IS1634 family transposase [Candidatus Woesearchaeota archaeon]
MKHLYISTNLYNYMYLRKKVDKGKIAYQIAESYREGGKVKTRIIKHLGPIEKLLDMVAMKKISIKIKNTYNYEFGASFILNEICNELNIEKHVDKYVKKQAEITNIGKAIKFASIHKCINQQGFNDIESWIDSTSLQFIESIEPKILKKQNFNTWLNNFDKKTVDNIQTATTESVIEKYKPDLSRIIIDFTSVDTYQKPREDRDQIANWGKSKKYKKFTFKINYALVCSNDGIPLHHSIYSGNINDPTYFKIFSKQVLKKYESFFKQKHNLIFVFDKGMNSEEGILGIAKDYKFVAGLKKSECKNISKDISKYKCISKDENGHEIRCLEFSKTKFKKKFRGIAVYHEKTAKLIEHQYKDKIKKVRKKLKIIKSKLNKPKWNDKEIVENRINNLLEKFNVTDLFDIKITEKESQLYIKKSTLLKEKLEEHKKEWAVAFLFTNLKKTSFKKIVDIYFREKNTVEDCNKLLKNVDFCRIGPVRCYINEHIRAHFLRCTIALTIGRILARIVNKKIKQNWRTDKIITKLKNLHIVNLNIQPFNIKDLVLSNYPKHKQLYDVLNINRKFKKVKKKF